MKEKKNLKKAGDRNKSTKKFTQRARISPNKSFFFLNKICLCVVCAATFRYVPIDVYCVCYVYIRIYEWKTLEMYTKLWCISCCHRRQCFLLWLFCSCVFVFFRFIYLCILQFVVILCVYIIIYLFFFFSLHDFKLAVKAALTCFNVDCYFTDVELAKSVSHLKYAKRLT